MSTPAWSPRRLHALDDAQIDGLADVLIDCVEGGASVSFMHPLPRDRAVAFWRRVAQGVAAGERALLVAEDARGLCGTVQLCRRCWCIGARAARDWGRRWGGPLKRRRANSAKRCWCSTPPAARRNACASASAGCVWA